MLKAGGETIRKAVGITKKCLSSVFSPVAVVMLLTAAGFQPLRADIRIVSYHLRDRAVIVDSLVLRKVLIFAFKSTQPLAQLKGAAAIGTLSQAGSVMARDTTWFYDQAAGNLGFGLPFNIPGGNYQLEITVLSKEGKQLDSYSGDFERGELKAYFNREINFWDFTSPYAHLECAGYGYLTYHLNSPAALKPGQLEISARITSDGQLPCKVKVSLNDAGLGVFDLPAAEREGQPGKITWKAEELSTLAGAAIVKGENALTLSVPEELNPRAMGLRIFAQKNSPDQSLEPGIPITLTVKEAAGAAGQVFSIPVWGTEGEHIRSKFNVPGTETFTEDLSGREQTPLPLGAKDIQRGYVVFHKPYLEYVYPWTIPAEAERADSLSARLSRNDYEPLTFSLYPVRDLGLVKVSAGDFQGPGGAVIPAREIEMYVAKVLKIRGGGDKYSQVPRLLDRTDSAYIPLGYTTRFWLTLHVPADQTPGNYRGTLQIEPQREPATELPVSLEVLPIRLEPAPGIAYSMFLSYEFFELESKDWNTREKELIYQDGVNIFKDYMRHGLNTVDVATPYYFQWNRDGSPRIEHLKAMLRGAKEAGFSEPIFWYFAHYVQAAKTQHPGSILLYKPKIHTERAKMLVRTALELNREMAGPPLYFVPIDEPRIALRQRITLELLAAIKSLPGVKTMSSTDIGGKLLDIEDDGEGLLKKLGPGEKVRKKERQVWEYSNAAISALNPGFTRYIYGYFTWRQDLDGMNSWGPSTTENSRGNPYEDLDHPYSDYMLFYPHTGAPLPSVNWEGLREGIDDVRYVYQLEKLIALKAAAHPRETGQAAAYLDELRGLCDIDENRMYNDFGDWTPERFDQVRDRVIGWIQVLSGL